MSSRSSAEARVTSDAGSHAGTRPAPHTGAGRIATRTRLLAAAAIVSGGTLFVKALGACKEVVVAHYFGRSDALDAFLVAFTIPTFAINIIGISLGVAFVPAYVDTLERRGHEAAHELFANAVFYSAAALAVTSGAVAVLGFFLLPLLAPHFGAAKLHLTRSLFLLLTPALTLNGLTCVVGAALNANGRFALAAVAPAATPIAAAIGIALTPSSVRIYGLTTGTLIGMSLELALVISLARKAGLRVLPRALTIHAKTATMFRQSLPRAAAAVATGGMLVIDQAMAARLGPGSVATLSYATKVPALLQGLAAGLSTACLPYFARLLSAGDLNGLRTLFRTYSNRAVLLAVPAAAVCIAESPRIVAAVFQNGAFTATDTHAVAVAQSCYMLQVPFYILSLLQQKLLAAINANTILLQVAVMALALDIPLNIVGIRYLGAAGIGLSTAALTAVSTLYMGVRLRTLTHRAPVVS